MQKNRFFPLVTLCLVSAAALAVAAGAARYSKAAIVGNWEENRRVYTKIAEQALTAGQLPEKLPGGVEDIRPWRGAQVDFLCRGQRFGSAGIYRGFYYSADNVIRTFQGGDQLFRAHGDGYLWQTPDGGNSCYVEPMDNHWYYFDMRV